MASLSKERERFSIKIVADPRSDPELVRGELPPLFAAIVNWESVSLEGGQQAKTAWREIDGLIGKLPPSLRGPVYLSIYKENPEDHIVFFDGVSPGEGEKKVYWWSPDLPRRDGGMFMEAILSLPPDKRLLAIERYIAWFGDQEGLSTNPVRVGIRASSPFVIETDCSRTESGLRMVIGASKNGTPTNALVALYENHGRFWRTSPPLRADIKTLSQEYCFSSEVDLRMAGSREMPVSVALDIPLFRFSAEVGTRTTILYGDGQEGIPLENQASPWQLGHLLVNLKYPQGFTPQLAEKKRQEQIDLLIDGISRMGR